MSEFGKRFSDKNRELVDKLRQDIASEKSSSIERVYFPSEFFVEGSSYEFKRVTSRDGVYDDFRRNVSGITQVFSVESNPIGGRRYKLVWSQDCERELNNIFYLKAGTFKCVGCDKSGRYILMCEDVTGTCCDSSIARLFCARAFKKTLHKDFLIDVDEESAGYLVDAYTNSNIKVLLDLTRNICGAYPLTKRIDNTSRMPESSSDTARFCMCRLLEDLCIDAASQDNMEYAKKYEKCLRILFGPVKATAMLKVAEEKKFDVEFVYKEGVGIVPIIAGTNEQVLWDDDLYIKIMDVLKSSCGIGIDEENKGYCDVCKVKDYFENKPANAFYEYDYEPEQSILNELVGKEIAAKADL